MLVLQHELPVFAASIETLLDQAFGPGRTAKTSYRYRDGVAPLAPLCFTALIDHALAGTVRHWPVTLSGGDALGQPLNTVLLGPIAVDPALKAMGIGAALMHHALGEARRLGVDMVVLVGDPAYYSRFGFRAAAAFGIVMPHETAHRVQALPLSARAAQTTQGGVILPASTLPLPVAA
ncbi:GNAT family N-acetyltransferase [Pararhodospirillum oryzae]|uniref:N-acetyltransferase GCN5 n=1 Tax=Pararhodospirillum oryzae TaxID=478448 RepID=A0A512H4K1_9PROT|nr:N-acetyltransferase [Pararhodospirillum oryzae]GEO80395.1 N-acetyltransferase GCN5 [Pararhodospirillum oryzae]